MSEAGETPKKRVRISVEELTALRGGPGNPGWRRRLGGHKAALDLWLKDYFPACPGCGEPMILKWWRAPKASIDTPYACCYRVSTGCRYELSPTTGTVAHQTHQPLDKWFRGAACFLDNPDCRPADIQIATGLNIKAAEGMLKKLRMGIIVLMLKRRQGEYVRRNLTAPPRPPGGQSKAAKELRRERTMVKESAWRARMERRSAEK